VIPDFNIENLTNLFKNLANLIHLTLKKQKICKKLPIFQWKQEKICQIKALPPFKWKPIDFWLVYVGIIISLRLHNTHTEFSLESPLGCLYMTLQAFCKVLNMLQ